MSGKPVCIADFEEYTKKFLPKSVYDYYRSGAGDQETLADNVAAFARWKLYPRVLRDVSVMDLSASVLGQKISMPVCVAATAMQRMAHADGETATAKALGQWIHWRIQGRMATVGQFGCHASRMPLRGKRREFAQLEKNSEFPFPYKAAVEHHIPILAVFGPEIKGSTSNSKLYHPDIENFPSLLCVAHATCSALPFTSTGACSVYKACHAMGTGMMLSSWATSSIEEVAEAAPAGLHWLQLYVYKDREVTKSLVKRAERAGYKGIFVTVDTPFLGRRIDDVRNKFQLPPHLRLKNFSSSDLAFSSGKDFGENSGLAVYVAEAIDASVNWEDIKWLRGLTSLPIVVKGILRADDAKEAVKIGVNGILVSNHGARQLDGVPATIDVLPEIVEAVEGKVEVFLDGGVRKGTDILKALALGAKAVFIGRPLIWGLVYQGEEGAKEVLQMLKEEFRLAMALTGCRRVEEIGRTLIRRHQVLFSKI